MNSIQISTQKVTDQSAEARIIFVRQQDDIASQLQKVSEMYPNIGALAHKRHFVGALGDTMVLPIAGDSNRVGYYLLVGLGTLSGNAIEVLEQYRRAVAKAVRTAVGLRASSIALQLPSMSLFVNSSVEYVIEQTVIICRMAQYHFDEFITNPDRKEAEIESTTICVDEADKLTAEKAVAHAELLANAVNTARHWIDAPPIHVTPSYLSKKAEEIGRKNNIKTTVFQESEVIAMGMGGLAAVSAGSDVDCQLVVMEYYTAQKDAPTIAFVGKGITFDSGGLSLKPAQSMETMKDDMSGAAAVIAAMGVIAQLKPDVNVIALAPLSENLPSGKATKPGDIIKFYNGKTAEVKNTDAEGRLILADALSYAVKHYKLDAIIDLATLTGACAYALGPFYSGLMSQHDDLVAKIQKASDIAGEYVWRLPMTDDYKKAIKSDVADICNIGDGRIKAGAITAAHFLQHFVGDVPWAHLDIAGTAFDVPNIPYFRSGATGVGVRMLVALASNWNKFSSVK